MIPIRRYRNLLATAGLAILVPMARAQVLPPATASVLTNGAGLNSPTTSLQPDEVEPAVPDTYRIGSNDLLSVFVYQMPELTSQVRVSAAGTIRMPMLPQPLAAAGSTGSELAASVAAALSKAGLARNPVVQVLVRQVDSRTVVISGAVRNPTVVQAWRPMTLLEALSRAGGVTDQAGSTVVLTEVTAAGTSTQTVSVDALENGAGPDPILNGQDTVRVVPARLVYTVGAVKQPGAFPLRPGEPLTVLRALSLSSGLAPSPNLHHSEILRPTAQGPQPVPIDLRRILDHKDPDPPLLAGDILYVPEDGKRKALGTIIADVGQIAVISLGYGASSKVF